MVWTGSSVSHISDPDEKGFKIISSGSDTEIKKKKKSIKNTYMAEL